MDLSTLKASSADLKQYITKALDLCFESLPISHDLRNFVKRHERRPLMEENLLRELKQTQNTAIRLDERKLVAVVADFARMFANATLANAEKKARRSNVSGMLNTQDGV
jgi:hypothetical protein